MVGVRSIEGMVRTHRDAVERSQGIRIEGDSPLVPWLVLWSAFVHNRFAVDVEGRTPYEKCKGKRFKRELLPFGEKVFWLPLSRSTRHTDRLNKLENKWQLGHFLGIIEGTDEAYIGLETGEVIKARAVKRLPPNERVDPEGLKKIRGVPWKPRPGDEDVAGRLGRRVDIERTRPEIRIPPQMEPRPEQGPRRTYIRKTEVERHGPTPGCPACASVVAVGFTQVAHTEVCRARMEERMQATEEGRRRLEETAERKRGRSPGEPSGSSGPRSIVKRERADEPARAETPPLPLGDRPAGEKRSREEQEDLGAKSPRRSGRKREPDEEAIALKEEIEREIADEIEEAMLEEGGESSGLSSLYHLVGYDVHVSEVYNPERFKADALMKGLRFGDAFDMKLAKEDGTHWDLSKPEEQQQCRNILERRRPLLLIGSPMCTMFSRLMQLNRKHFTDEEWKAKMEDAKAHLRFAFELYRWQQDEGRLWLHEHPLGASSWNLDFVKEFLEAPEVMKVRGDMCRWGMKAPSGENILKPTGWATNSKHLAVALARRCKGGHQHIPLMEGRAAGAAIYPPQLVKGILEGLIKEMRTRGLQHDGEIGSLDAEEPDTDWNAYKHEWQPTKEEQEEEEVFYDSVSGKVLDPKLIAEAKKEEIKIAHEYDLYEKVPLRECYERTGKAPIGIKWVYTNKGDENQPQYRARLCAKEIKAKDPYLEGVFAPTPPIEGLRLLLSLAFTAEKGKREPDCIMVLDATRAHWHSPARREVYVELAPEDRMEAGDDQRCAKLRKSMYGCRDAAANWEEFSTGTLKEIGFRPGVASPCLMWHEDWKVRLFKHGDDFVMAGTRNNLIRAREGIEKKIKMKCQGVLGLNKELGDLQAIRVLNRIISIDKDEVGNPYLAIEADNRHVEILVQGLGLKPESKGRVAPGEKPKMLDQTPLDSNMITQYRSLTMRANFLAEDRYDIKFAAKELARDMKVPMVSSWEKLKHLGRYLLKTPRAISVMKWQPWSGFIRAASDSDWAGCVVTRRSTTAVVILHGKHLIRGYSGTQQVPALSSGEAEYNAAIKGIGNVLGTQAFAEDLGVRLKCVLGVDSSAALGMLKRTGLGKVRHIATPLLWAQAVVAEGRCQVQKEKGEANPADLGTKYLAGPRTLELAKAIGYIFKSDKSPIALKAQL